MMNKRSDTFLAVERCTNGFLVNVYREEVMPHLLGRSTELTYDTFCFATPEEVFAFMAIKLGVTLDDDHLPVKTN